MKSINNLVEHHMKGNPNLEEFLNKFPNKSSNKEKTYTWKVLKRRSDGKKT